jgi:hypothetical protein
MGSSKQAIASGHKFAIVNKSKILSNAQSFAFCEAYARFLFKVDFVFADGREHLVSFVNKQMTRLKMTLCDSDCGEHIEVWLNWAHRGEPEPMLDSQKGCIMLSFSLNECNLMQSHGRSYATEFEAHFIQHLRSKKIKGWDFFERDCLSKQFKTVFNHGCRQSVSVNLTLQQSRRRSFIMQELRYSLLKSAIMHNQQYYNAISVAFAKFSEIIEEDSVRHSICVKLSSVCNLPHFEKAAFHYIEQAIEYATKQ